MSLRDRLAAQLPADAWPSAKLERWRYWPLRTLERLDLDTPPQLQAATPLSAEGYVAGLADGGVALPSHRYDQPGDAFAALAQLVPPLVAQTLGDGAAVHVDLAAEGALCTRRVVLRIAAGAQARLLIHERGAATLSNTLIEIELLPGAQLDLLRLGENAAGSHALERVEVRLRDQAQLRWKQLELGGGMAHRENNVHLLGEGASVVVDGAVLAGGRSHQDQQWQLLHGAAKTRSDTRWKAIADGRARSVFAGRIAVAANAIDTEAHLNTAALLLSEQAEVYARPDLVIDTDAVVCSHGASVGQLDAAALFYLQSRGIGLAQARQMLCFAFVEVVLQQLPDPQIADAFARRLQRHLPEGIGQ